MAIAVTSRGTQYLSNSSAALVFDAFQPAQNSLLIMTVGGNDTASNDIVESVTSDGSWAVSTWTKLFDVAVTGATGSVSLEIWGAIVTGASPASATVSFTKGYHGKVEGEIYEVTGANVSGGTAASCIGVSATNVWSDAELSSKSLTLDAFASATNGAFATVWTQYGTDNITFTEGTWTSGVQRGAWATTRLRSAWTDAEDTSVVFTTQQYVYVGAAAFEVKAAGGAASIVPQAMANYRMRAA